MRAIRGAFLEAEIVPGDVQFRTECAQRFLQVGSDFHSFLHYLLRVAVGFFYRDPHSDDNCRLVLKHFPGIQDVHRIERLLDAALHFDGDRSQRLFKVRTFQNPDSMFSR